MSTTNNIKSIAEVVLSYEQALSTLQDAGVELTTKAIDDFVGAWDASRVGHTPARDATSLHWQTRFGSALTRWVLMPSTVVTQKQLEQLCFRKRHLSYLFAASGFRSTGHLGHNAVTRHADGQETIALSKLAVVLALMSINDVPSSFMDKALQFDPQVLLPLMLGWLSERANLTRLGEENRSRLLASAEKVRGANINHGYLNTFTAAWMFCSYAELPEKHDFKAVLNDILCQHLKTLPLPSGQVAAKSRSRPVALVILENLHSWHAMYRCYEKQLRSMRQYFQLIAIADKQRIDAKGAELFDDGHYYDLGGSPLDKTVQIIREISPDLIYYPSVGMHPWIICLANLRLAPIQLAALGHPATTRSAEMDYVITCVEGDVEKVCGERILVWEDDVLFSAHPDLQGFDLPEKVYSSGTVNIGVASKVMKLNYRLLDICRSIRANANCKVNFHFFPGESKIALDGVAAMIDRELPGANVYGEMPYLSLMTLLANCDLCLSAFPFGNTNGTVDACLLGIPNIAHFGPEPPAQTDKLVFRKAGYPLWLVAHSDEEYLATALRLINKPTELAELRASLPQRDVAARNMFGDEDAAKPNSFGDLMNWVWHNHTRILESGTRVIRWADIQGNA